MNNLLLENIYKEIPICYPITMFLQDLENISKQSELLVKKVDNLYEPFFNHINKYINGTAVTFFMTLSISSNNETLKKEVKFSKAGFINSLLFNLNVNNICNTNNNKIDTKKTIDEFTENAVVLLEDRIKLLNELGQEYRNLLIEENDKINKLQIEIQEITTDINNNINEKKYRNQKVSKLKEKEKNKRRHERKIKEIQLEYETKLAESFPDLYKNYLDLKENCDGLKSWKDAIEDPNKTKTEQDKIKARLLNAVNKQGINITYEDLIKDVDKPVYKFTSRYCKVFKDLIDNTSEILDFLDKYTINIDNLGIEQDKLELYLANQALLSCEFGNEYDRQNYIYYVADYFRQNYNRKNDENIMITVNTGDKKELITPKILYSKYISFLLKNPEVTVLDLTNFNFTNLTVEKINDLINKYLKVLKANWEIIPPEKLDKVFIEVTEKTTNEFSEAEKIRHRERLIELYMDKKELYGTTSPMYIIEGKNTFDGYIGFIYNNGKVVLDKFFKHQETEELADGQAVYVMNIADFERLSVFSKSVLKKDPTVTRIVHYGKWEERVKQIIKENSTKISPEEEIDRLLKTKDIIRKK